MRLKTFTAETMPEAMAQVRDEMGDEAIIVSTQPGADGLACRVTAAIEEELLPDPITNEPEPTIWNLERDTEETPDNEERTSYLRQVLMAHGLPPHIAEALLRTIDTLPEPDPALALAAAIDSLVSFRPIDVTTQRRPLILVGIPGAGKTITAAKLAAQAKLNKRSVFIATTDSKRAGGVEQLAAFTRILNLDLQALSGPGDLTAHKTAMENADITVIDTPGANPFDENDLNDLRRTAELIDGELLLILPAGGDALESADTAAAFTDIGAERMVITRLDITRRLGGILGAAVSGRIAVANVSINPNVADGLTQLNPLSLARLIIPEDEDQHKNAHPHTKAAS